MSLKKKLDVSKLELTPIIWTGEKLREFRCNLGLTQTEIGEIVGLTPASISQIETGVTKNPFILVGYGAIVERLYALDKGYIPAYRKIGTNEFTNEI